MRPRRVLHNNSIACLALRTKHCHPALPDGAAHTRTHARTQARTILLLLRAFYVNDDDYALVHRFNHQQAAFKFEDVLAKMGLAPEGGGPPAGAPGGPGATPAHGGPTGQQQQR